MNLEGYKLELFFDKEAARQNLRDQFNNDNFQECMVASRHFQFRTFVDGGGRLTRFVNPILTKRFRSTKENEVL